uniref:Uncharacterized protein n=1 Tax=Ciona savignyi TaxID=51511 RepID=H2YK93_CIOSA
TGSLYKLEDIVFKQVVLRSTFQNAFLIIINAKTLYTEHQLAKRMTWGLYPVDTHRK